MVAAATANYIHRSSLCDVVVYVGTAYTLVNFRFFKRTVNMIKLTPSGVWGISNIYIYSKPGRP